MQRCEVYRLPIDLWNHLSLCWIRMDFNLSQNANRRIHVWHDRPIDHEQTIKSIFTNCEPGCFFRLLFVCGMRPHDDSAATWCDADIFHIWFGAIWMVRMYTDSELSADRRKRTQWFIRLRLIQMNLCFLAHNIDPKSTIDVLLSWRIFARINSLNVERFTP